MENNAGSIDKATYETNETIHEAEKQEVEEETNLGETTGVQNKKRIRTEKPIRIFPQYSIKEAMQIPQIIGQKNAGNPWAPEYIANVLDTSKQTNAFFYLTSASRDYGFTIGTSKAKSVELTALGRKIAFPESIEDETLSIFEAFNNIDVFKKLYEYYHGFALPEDKYLCNTLKETFAVDPIYHDEFIMIFKTNLGLLAKISSSTQKTASNQGLPSTVMTSTKSENNREQKEIFVIMPFTEKTDDFPKGYFDEVYNSLIVPAAAGLDLIAKTAKRTGSDIIHSTIVSDIYHADIILADLTEHNPNVLFELGLAIAFKKKVALIRAKGTSPIFDIDNLMRVYDYDKNLWKSTIERDIPNLSKHIAATAQTNDTTYLDLLLKKA